MSHSHVLDNIFIGDSQSVLDDQFLTKNNIVLIINASNIREVVNKLDIPTVFIKNFEDMSIGNCLLGVHGDHCREYCEDMITKAEKIAKIMHYFEKKYNGNILVHCLMGINRSAFVICYYLHRYKKRSKKQIFSALFSSNIINRKRRFLTNPCLLNIFIELKHE